MYSKIAHKTHFSKAVSNGFFLNIPMGHQPQYVTKELQISFISSRNFWQMHKLRLVQLYAVIELHMDEKILMLHEVK